MWLLLLGVGCIATYPIAVMTKAWLFQLLLARKSIIQILLEHRRQQFYSILRSGSQCLIHPFHLSQVDPTSLKLIT
jgi:hypothetical protein